MARAHPSKRRTFAVPFTETELAEYVERFAAFEYPEIDELDDTWPREDIAAP